MVLQAPAGAEIHVDQQFAGHSTGDPSRIKVEPGQRVIEVFLAGYLPWKQLVSVEPGKRADVIVNLAPGPIGNLDAASGVSDADMAQIRQLLTRYQSAVNGRDLKQIKAVWPEIPPKKLEQFKTLPKGAKISLTLTRANLLEGNENVIVRCKQSYQADGDAHDDNVTFYLGRLNADWIINEIPSSN